MRRFAIACAALCLFAIVSTRRRDQDRPRPRHRVRDYISADQTQDNNAARAPHPCRTSCKASSSLGRTRTRAPDAMVKGLPFTSKEACVRMPDFLSYRDMAQRVVNYGKANPAALDGPAATLAQKTLERDFPCPPQSTRRADSQSTNRGT